MTLSALEDRDFTPLIEELTGLMPEGPSFYPEDLYTDQTERVMVSEIIREKILRLTHDEVPHAVAVKVNEMKTVIMGWFMCGPISMWNGIPKKEFSLVARDRC